MAEEEARFGLRIDADGEPAKEAAAALERFRAAIEKSQDKILAYRKSMTLLKGSSDEVKDAKEKLRAAIAAEQAAITKDNLAILKLGGSYEKLQKAHKKSTEAFAAANKVVKASGGPLRELADRLSTLKEIAGGVTSGWGLLAVAGVAVIAGIAALTVAAVGLIAKFTEWTVVSGDALRNMRLVREAASGGEKNATAWGHAIDWLSLKVATSKDVLNELAVATERSLRGTRVSGQGMVDVFQAVAQSASAMGDQAGKKIEDLLTRGKQSGRFGIDFTAPGISELQGTGITFKQVAQQLAKNLNVGLDQAQKALLTHAVTIDAGAKALRQVVESQLGDINAKKMLSLGSLFTKFQDNIRDWAQDIAGANGAFEPLLGSLKKVVDLFGLQSESGQKMKAAVTQYATALAGVIDRNLPTMKEMVVAGLAFAAAVIRITAGVVSFLSSSTGLALIKDVLVGMLVLTSPLVVAFVAVGAAIAGITLAVGAAYNAVRSLGDALGKWLLSVDWGGIGTSIVDGIKAGLLAAWDKLKSTVVGLATNIRNVFAGPQGIDAHSPSKKFALEGRKIPQGVAMGVEDESRVANTAIAQMVSVDAPSGAAAGAPGAPASGGPVELHLHLHGVEGGRQGAEQLASGPTLAALAFAVRTGLRQAGISTGAPVVSGG